MYAESAGGPKQQRALVDDEHLVARWVDRWLVFGGATGRCYVRRDETAPLFRNHQTLKFRSCRGKTNLGIEAFWG